MGGILSSYKTTVTSQNTTSSIKTTGDESNPSNTVNSIPTLASESATQDVTKLVTETVVPTTTDLKVEAEQSSVETGKEDVVKHYIEPSGTKLEVDPVEVAPSDDVVKKKKRKHKKHH
jgi:hypothetical protein